MQQPVLLFVRLMLLHLEPLLIALQALPLQLPVTVVAHTLIFGGYDNLVARWGAAGSALRSALQALEHTPLRAFGLSHFMVLKKN